MRVDRSAFADGPWSDEPDAYWWTDANSKMPCLVARHPFLGSWRGFVGVSTEHPLHGIAHDRCARPGCNHANQTICEEWFPLALLDAHGGIGFACARGFYIDVPESLGTGGEWWFGFGAHEPDLQPGKTFEFRQARMRYPFPGAGDYRTLSFMRHECGRLAAQLEKLALEWRKVAVP